MKRSHGNWKAWVVAAAFAGSGRIAVAQQGQCRAEGRQGMQQGQGQRGQGQFGQGQQMQAPIAGAQPLA